ncbi:hypothetical protein [Hyphomonas sp.]|uniref:hypothetical protein n=1 Tax=Hyphomonas sp. TaxID=87 RepID=UPI001BCF693A|nr:hypothetical protein [Hyphomonas sp.]
MKKLLASCAVVALMAAPAIAQSTIDPATPDMVPVDPQVQQMPEETDMLQPQTDVLPEALPPEPDMAEEVPPPVPDAEPALDAELTEEDESSLAETESEPKMTVEIAPGEPALEAAVNQTDLPEAYSTDDLNAMMLAQVNTAGAEIAALDSQADIWVSADGSPVDPSYAPEGQGDMETTTEDESYVTPETDYITTTEPEADDYVTPEPGTPEADSWTQEQPVMPEEEAPVDNTLTNDNPANTDY